MKQTKTLYLLLITVAVLVMGIAYAAVTNIQFSVTGNATVAPSADNFKVVFGKVGTADAPTFEAGAGTSAGVNVEFTTPTDRAATLDVTGLKKVGDTVTAIFKVINESTDLDATLTDLNTTGTNNYFTVTAKAKDNVIPALEKTDIEVTVTLKKLPVASNAVANVSVNFSAAPTEIGSVNGGTGGAGGEGGSGNTEGYEEVALSVAITDDMYSRTENSQTKDIYGNAIKIPAGFKILVDSTTGYTGTTDIAVEKGIVIIDEAGNEFVYVPVGSIKTASETKNIQLARYTFDVTLNMSTGALGGTGAIAGTHTSATDELTDPLMTVMAQEQGIDNPIFVEGEIEGIDDQEKGYALNIGNFINKASTGYYIGRYEARTNSTTAREEGDALTSVTLNKNNAVYNYITQPDATNVCQNMYTEKPFTTDLVNSFAWDTAIVFIQSFEDSDYSLKASVNTSFSNTGTVGAETQDKVCNIYDMASNCVEWSTETNSTASHPCTHRGGIYDGSDLYTSIRFSDSASFGFDYHSFRPLLYL